jgi:hypothetical protein
MRKRGASGRIFWRSVIGSVGACGVALAMGAISQASASQTGPVSATPAAGTPQLAPTGTTEQVRQLVQCGTRMYAVGSFTEIQKSGTTYSRNNIFSFSASAPYTVTAWNPNVSGAVDTITFDGSNCSDAYIGGSFSSVKGTSVHDIAEVDTASGAVVPAFGHSANGEVATLLATHGRLLAGGSYTSINGNSTDPYMTGLNLTTGKNDGYLQLHISGHYQYQNVHTNSTFIHSQQLSHSRNLDLVEGDFTSVGGLPRQQIFMLSLGSTGAAVTGWSSPEWDGSLGNVPGGYPYQCGDSKPFYIRAAAWSPDDSTVYLGDTGYHPWNLPTGSYPRSGLCDAVAAFPATQTEVTHKWINYTGCNSLYSVAADDSAVYVGGHEQWADNSFGCKFAGTGAIPAPGMGGFGPASGSLILNSSGTAGLYSRARGFGADDMLLTSAGLWIASDNYAGSNSCGGVSGHAGICFLPYG